MARFRAGAIGRRDSACTRLGSAESGVCAFADGWDVGGEVRLWAEDDVDMVEFTLTGGSNGSAPSEVIAVFRRRPGEEIERIR